MKKITFCLFFYNLPHMVTKQSNHWRSMPKKLRDQCSLIIIDDCSKEPVTHEMVNLDGVVDYRLLRVTKDIPWNWGVKNLGWHEAKTPWVFLNDADYFSPAKTLEKMLEIADSGPGTRYFFRMSEAINKPAEWENWKKDWPAAQYLVHRDDIERTGGYDEDLAGRRGYDDVLLQDALDALGVKISRISDYTVFLDWDGRTPGLNRNAEENKKLYLQKRENPLAPHGPIIRFPWEEVCKE